jgi:putative acetyltransferase
MIEEPTDRQQILLTTADWDDPEGRQLREDQQFELRQIYGADTEPGVKPSSSDVQVFVVAWTASANGGTRQALGCGGLRRLDNTTAEIKRMYVQPAHRGRGLSRRILAELEARARAAGWNRLRLETGPLQHSAMRLYESAGYARIPNFGHYRDSATSLCYEKVLHPES